MTIYQFETNSTTFNCNVHDDGTRIFVKDAVSVGAYVEVTLTGITAGWYDLSVNYAQGFGDSISPWKLTVNSAEEHILYFKNTPNWGTWVTNYLAKIYLSTGTNVLRFTQYGAAADLDFFDLTFSQVQNNAMPEMLIYWNNGSNILTTPARQNTELTDTDFTANNYNLSQANSNRALVCENTVTSTITLPDINWEIIEKYAEIEIFRVNAALQIIVGSGLTSIGTSTFNIRSGGFAYLKHLKNKQWFIQGDFE